MQSIRQYRQLRETVKQAHSKNSLPSAENNPKVLDDISWQSGTSDEDLQKVANGEVIAVEWEGPKDPLSPRNWPLTSRIGVFCVIWINVFALDWAGSADAQAGSKIGKEFHVSAEAETLSPALYTFGIAVGALFAGPISETIGRNPIYIGSRCFQLFWLLGAALAPNFAAQLVFRFLAGLGGSIILAIHAASVADIFSLPERTIFWPIIALASLYGPTLSPLAGAWIAASNIDWRWTEWIALIFSGFTLILALLFLPETFAPILLKWKASHIRAVTGNDRYKAQLDLQKSVGTRLRTALLRALHMLTREPIVPLLGLWLILVYIAVYGFLQGMSFIFTDTYGFSKGITGTCFASIAVGSTLWVALSPLYARLYMKKIRELERQNGDKEDFSPGAQIPGHDLPAPEYRLWASVPVALLLPISFYWLGWTNYARISPWSDLCACALFGVCWAGIYVCVYQYILDVYGIYAGSALAIITFFRYAASGAVNLFARPMYSGIGVHWTMTMLGCFAVVLAAAPFGFMQFGPKIRKRSKFAGRYARPLNERKRIGRAASWK